MQTSCVIDGPWMAELVTPIRADKPLSSHRHASNPQPAPLRTWATTDAARVNAPCIADLSGSANAQAPLARRHFAVRTTAEIVPLSMVPTNRRPPQVKDDSAALLLRPRTADDSPGDFRIGSGDLKLGPGEPVAE